jgi:hypothetical protein
MLRFRPLRGINTIGRTLKKTPKRYPGQQGVIPPETNSALLAAMEDVLAAPGRASTIRDCRLVCMDELSKQLIAQCLSANILNLLNRL